MQRGASYLRKSVMCDGDVDGIDVRIDDRPPIRDERGIDGFSERAGAGNIQIGDNRHGRSAMNGCLGPLAPNQSAPDRPKLHAPSWLKEHAGR